MTSATTDQTPSQEARTPTSHKRFGLWLLPGFSSLAHASIVEPLLACRRLNPEVELTLEYWGLSKHIKSAAGASVEVRPIDTCLEPMDALFCCGGTPAYYPPDKELIGHLRRVSPLSRRLVGVASGSYLLARAGMLDGHRAVIHWWQGPELALAFPEVSLSDEVFCLDGDRATCRGGTAALDMMSLLLAQIWGHEMIEMLSEYFVRERIGTPQGSSEIQALDTQTQVAQPKLAEAIELMHRNIEEPLSTEELSQHVGLSRRQLERLFRKYLHTVPSRYYLSIRLDRARKLLNVSSQAISQIAMACGFRSSAHFSSAFRNQFGFTPSEARDSGFQA